MTRPRVAVLAMACAACGPAADASADRTEAKAQVGPRTPQTGSAPRAGSASPAMDDARAPPPDPEFGAVPLCSVVRTLPEDAAPLGESCDLNDQASGCRFTTARDAGAVRYQVLGGVVRLKEADLSPDMTGPHGLSASDDARTASAKVASATGVELRRTGDAGDAFLQSDEMPCIGNTYRVVVDLDPEGKATRVLLTTLPTD